MKPHVHASAEEGEACPLAEFGEVPGAELGPGRIAVAVAAVRLLPAAKQVGYNPPVSDVRILQLLIVQRALPSVAAVIWLHSPCPTDSAKTSRPEVLACAGALHSYTRIEASLLMPFNEVLCC